jgi:hypothetical protein
MQTNDTRPNNQARPDQEWHDGPMVVPLSAPRQLTVEESQAVAGGPIIINRDLGTQPWKPTTHNLIPQPDMSVSGTIR